MNEQAVRQTYNILGHKIGTHIRMLDPKGERRPQMLDVQGEEEFVRACAEAGEDWHIYVGCNERVSAGANGVMSIGSVLIDIDPQLAGNEGTKWAIAAAETIARYSIAENIHEYPLVACSGNGAYVWFCTPRIPPGDTAERQSLRLALRKLGLYLAEKVADFPVKVDVQVTADIARIIRVIGTRNIKGRYADSEAGLDARWAKMSFWLFPPKRHESPNFWPFVEALRERYKHKDVDATHILPVPAPGALDFFFKNCPRMASLAGRSNTMGDLNELEDYQLWLSFGANLVKACGQIGAAEWKRVSEQAPKFDPWNFDESNSRNKVQEVIHWNGPPTCANMGCNIAGNPNCPKAPAGWAFRYAGALVTAARVDGIPPHMMEARLMQLLLDSDFHMEQALDAQTTADQRLHIETVGQIRELLYGRLR